MQVRDFIFVQWYKNLMCNVSTPASFNNFKAWSAQLAKKGSGPKHYIGLPGCEKCRGSGYLKISALKSTLNDAKGANMSIFVWAILWDGPQALANRKERKDYLTQLKEALSQNVWDQHRKICLEVFIFMG